MIFFSTVFQLLPDPLGLLFQKFGGFRRLALAYLQVFTQKQGYQRIRNPLDRGCLFPLVGKRKSDGGGGGPPGATVDGVRADQIQANVLFHLVDDLFGGPAILVFRVEIEAVDNLHQPAGAHDTLLGGLDPLLGVSGNGAHDEVGGISCSSMRMVALDW